MRRDQHDEFWRMYDKSARPVIERACRSASARLTDRTMDADDMGAWVHQRVWKLLERDAAPTFHDDPSPEVAIERLIEHAGTLARWAYMAQCRRHWKREQNKAQYTDSMSQAERLSMVSTVGNGFEQQESLTDELSKLKAALGPDLSAKLAATWPEKSERNRVAVALAATRPEDQELIANATDGTLKENTVQQIRSRARRRAQEIATLISKSSLAVSTMAFILGLGMTASVARADGEQSGGRGGSGQSIAMMAAMTADASCSGGEQSGGRGGGLMVASAYDGEQTGSPLLSRGGGEQSGGRGG
ncbi:MAG: hypothetical protein ACI89L_000136 [Phycisphaerales bacterium]|jgi:hypothetical protein